MLKSISFKNYKSFKQNAKLEIKPLTILVGPNNAGKTSITELFALFKQSTSGNYDHDSFLVFNGTEGIMGPLDRIINYKSMDKDVKNKSMEIRLDLDFDYKPQNIEDDINIIVSREESYEMDYRFWYADYMAHPEFGPEYESPDELKSEKYAGDKTLQSKLNEIFNFFVFNKGSKSSLKVEIESLSNEKFKQRIKFIKGPLGGYEMEMYPLKNDTFIKRGIYSKQNLVNVIASKKHAKQLHNLNKKLMNNILEPFYMEQYFSLSPSFIKKIKSIEKEVNEYSFGSKSFTGDGLLNYSEDLWIENDQRYYAEEQWGYSHDNSPEPFIEIPDWLKRFVYSNRKHASDEPSMVQEFFLEFKRSWARNAENPIKQKYKYSNKNVVEIYLSRLFSLRLLMEFVFRKQLTLDEEIIISQCIRNFLLFSQIPAIQVVYDNILGRIIKRYSFKTDNFFNAINVVDIRASSPASTYSKKELIKFIGEPAFLFADDIELIRGGLGYTDVNKKNLLNAVNHDLESIGLKYKLIIEGFGPPNSPNLEKRYAFLLENHDGQCFGLHEIGYGLSQLIPLLIGKNYFSMLNRGNSTTIIREPEANVHPSLQAKIASNLVSTIKDEKYNSSIIVETHSEHFIRGVQIAVAKGDIKSTDVNILYVNQSKSGNSSLKKIELEEKGKFKSEWPKGFFESGFKEVVELNKLQKS